MLRIDAREWPSVYTPLNILSGVGAQLSRYMFYGYNCLVQQALSHHSWLVAPNSWQSRVHLAAIAVLTAGKQGFYDHQETLPHLPVPDLRHTIESWLKSVYPLVSDEEYQRAESAAKQFLADDGVRLQKRLQKYAGTQDNWLKKIWEEYAYLKNREPLLLSTDWYGTDSVSSDIARYAIPQTDRAARIIFLMVEYHLKLQANALPQQKLKETVPVCVDQYRSLFGVVRVPHVGKDELQVHDQSHHIIVLKEGQLFKVQVLDEAGALMSESAIRSQLRFIAYNSCEFMMGKDVSWLTLQSRSAWAEDRNYLKTLFPVNKESLETVETALFAVRLSDEKPESVEALCRALMVQPDNGWFDKGVLMTVFANGRTGGTMEHSFADATIVASMQDEVYGSEMRDPLPPDDEELCDGPPPLRWVLDDTLNGHIAAVQTNYPEKAADFDFRFLEFGQFGDGFIKKNGMSPDSFVQMALQLAYYKLHEECVLTYETAATRLFLKGRTETIRSSSAASVALCKGFAAGCDREWGQALFRRAVKEHVKVRELASQGLGCDRHLLGLRVMAGEENVPFFQEPLLQLPFKLATSQTPTRHTFGGGFWPVCEDGYGVSYHFCKTGMRFHISCHRKCATTDSQKFEKALVESLEQLHQLFA